ncbi:hypothetical protein D3C87_1647900 [compost metagenome]
MLNICFVSNIRLYGGCFSAGGLNLLHSFISGLQLNIGHDYLGTFACIENCYCFAHSGSCTGDYRDLIPKSHFISSNYIIRFVSYA